MRSTSPAASGRWAPHLAATVLFAVLCGIATYWSLQLFAPRTAIAPAGSLVDWQKAPDLSAASRLFGMPQSAVQAQRTVAAVSNIKVIGVAASPTRGSAVLSLDGKPPRAFLAGEPIDDQTVLLEVRPDAVIIERPGGRIELPTPERPDPALLGSGPAASTASATAAPVPATPAASRQPPAPPRPLPSPVAQPAVEAPAPAAPPQSAQTPPREPAPVPGAPSAQALPAADSGVEPSSAQTAAESSPQATGVRN